MRQLHYEIMPVKRQMRVVVARQIAELKRWFAKLADHSDYDRSWYVLDYHFLGSMLTTKHTSVFVHCDPQVAQFIDTFNRGIL